MKRAYTSLLGNSFMVVGGLLSLVSLAIALLSQVAATLLTETWATGSVLGIFLGAFFWLMGAQIGGHEKVCEKYYLLRFQQRRQSSHREA